jgi:hydrogenase maturation protease
MRGSRVLVAGVGNVFLGDDGFGVRVVERLREVALPDEVDVVDYGIRGVHLAYELLDGRYATLVLVDAVPLSDEPPGTLAVLHLDPRTTSTDHAVVNAHAMSPQIVVETLRGLGGEVPRIVVVGCRPAAVDEGMDLSPPVQAALDNAAALTARVARDEAARLVAAA